MTKILFGCDADGLICSVELVGHAGFAAQGEDIVCAAISSAVQLTHILLENVQGLKTDTKVCPEDTYIKISLPQAVRAQGQSALRALKLHYEELCAEYAEFINVTEVQTNAED